MGQTNYPQQQDAISRLNQLAEAYAPHDGIFELPIPGVRIFRSSRPDPQPMNVMSPAGVCIVTQGAKRVILGNNIYEYDRSKMIVYAIALPVEATIIKASSQEPYYCVMIDMPQQKISELTLRVFSRGLPKGVDIHTIHLGHSDEKVIMDIVRLIELMKTPKEMKFLSDLILDEIFIRLLCSSFGPSIAQIRTLGSNTGKIARAISWIRENYSEPMDVRSLANLASMSESSFHRHFKSVTSMSPVQFQKILRLQEAKNLMLSEMMDVTTASQQVGYTSSSQFSREYSRFFGLPPVKDIARSRFLI